MKKLLLLAFLWSAAPGFAQNVRLTCNPPNAAQNTQPGTCAGQATDIVTASSTRIYQWDVSGTPIVTHTVSWTSTGSPTVGITIYGSTDGASMSSLTTSTTATSSYSFTGTYSSIGVAVTALNRGALNFSYFGSAVTSADVTAELESVVSELESANTTLDAIETAVEDTTDIGVLPRATNTGGQTIWGLTTTATVNTSTVTSAATGVYTIWAFNPTETEAFIHFHNDGTPDCDESSTNVFIMGVPPSPAAGQQGGFLIPLTIPITGNFTTAVGICVKGDADASSDTVAPAGILVGIGYKIAS